MSKSVDLPVIESCDGCGACCFEQGAPPDYVALRLNPQFADDPTFAEDAERLAQLPAAARELLADYLRKSAAGTVDTNGVCVWFDASTTGCRYYDWRPSTCRVFERSSAGCRIYRRRHGVEEAAMENGESAATCDVSPPPGWPHSYLHNSENRSDHAGRATT